MFRTSLELVAVGARGTRPQPTTISASAGRLRSRILCLAFLSVVVGGYAAVIASRFLAPKPAAQQQQKQQQQGAVDCEDWVYDDIPMFI